MTESWKVYVDDNFHYMDESERYKLGEFSSYAEAVLACKAIVDACLGNTNSKTADELYQSYVSFGDDPWVKGPSPDLDGQRFSAWEYARARCNELLP